MRRLRQFLEAMERRQEVYGRTAVTLQTSTKSRNRSEARRELRDEENRLAGIREAFFRDWCEGWPMPNNCMMCDGEPWIEGNAAGRHLRPVKETREVYDDNYKQRVVYKPYLHSGEVVANEPWNPVPLIRR